jgi:hypothetical protein
MVTIGLLVPIELHGEKIATPTPTRTPRPLITALYESSYQPTPTARPPLGSYQQVPNKNNPFLTRP